MSHQPSLREDNCPTCPAPMIKWSAKDIRHFVNGVSLLPPDGAKQINEFLSKNLVDGKRFVKLRVEDLKAVNPRWSRTLIDALEIEKKRRVTAKSKALTNQESCQVVSTETSDLILDQGSISSPSEPETTVLFEEPLGCDSPPSPRPHHKNHQSQSSDFSCNTSPTPSQLYFNKDVLKEKVENQAARSYTLPLTMSEMDHNDVDRLLRRRLKEERQILLHDFQIRLHEQQTRFHQELTLNLQDHNVNFQMDLDETLNSHQTALINHLEREISTLTKKMVKETNKEKVKWVLLQTSVDQWKLEMVELRNQLIQHIEEEKEKWEIEASRCSWQILASGIGIGAALTYLLLKYIK